MQEKSVLILGGYGNFGKRIVETLGKIQGLTVLIAGRSIGKAQQLAEQLQSSARATLAPLAIDITSLQFPDQLRSINPDIVIHTSGPFQGQDYQVAETCIALGVHYIDLADGRGFVTGITQLNDVAVEYDVAVVSGASTVPGLSSVVIDHYRDRFAEISELDIAIAPGNRAERGEATVRGILSYTGHPFSVFKGGKWVDAFGWMESRQVDFDGILGKRRVANVDVPDLELFPQRYDVRDSVRFQAGLELPVLHESMVLMAKAVRRGVIKNWSPLTKPIVKVSNVFRQLGSDDGGMRVRINGVGLDGKPLMITWLLYAEGGVGPYIPTLSAIIVAKKLLEQRMSTRGAMPCLGMYSLDEFSALASQWGIYSVEQIDG